MNSLTVLRTVAVWMAAMFFFLLPLKAQKVYITDKSSTVRTSVLTYSWGVTGYGGSHGISAWDTDGKSGGVANALRQMFYSSSRNTGYGCLFYSDRHSQHFHDRGMKERVQLFYLAPQASCLKRTTMFPACFATFGGGIGYVYYQSKSALSSEPDIKISTSSAGINGFINMEYTFARHWGICLEVNALYSPLNPGRTKREAPFRQRDKFGLFMLTTQLGISCHL